jgi:hypothetical protein
MRPVMLNDDNGRALVIEVEDEGALVSRMKELGYVRAFISGEPFGLKLVNERLKQFTAHPWTHRPYGKLLSIGTKVSWDKKYKGLLLPYSLSKKGVIVRINDSLKSYDIEDETGYMHCSVGANEVRIC